MLGLFNMAYMSLTLLSCIFSPFFLSWFVILFYTFVAPFYSFKNSRLCRNSPFILFAFCLEHISHYYSLSYNSKMWMTYVSFFLFSIISVGLPSTLSFFLMEIKFTYCEVHHFNLLKYRYCGFHSRPPQ